MAEESTETAHTAPAHQVGCCDLPPNMSRQRYFESLSLLEVGAFFRGNPTRKAVRTWREKSPSHVRFSLLAHHDLLTCDEPEMVKKAGHLVDSCKILDAEAVVVIAPTGTAGLAQRERLEAVFSGPMSREALGNCRRVFVPEGLWEPAAARKVGEDLDVLVAIDPLANDPLGEQLGLVDSQLARGEAYLRIMGLGHSRRRFDSFALEGVWDQIAGLARSWTLFGHPGKYPDALAFQRLLASEEE